MKNLLLIVIAAILFLGCSKNNGPSPIPANSGSITGKWYITTDTARLYQNGVLSQSDILNFNRTDYIVFNADGTGTTVGSGIVNNFTYTGSGGTITMSIPQQANNGTPLAPLIQTATIKLLTTTNLTLDFVTTFTYGNGTLAKETANEYFVR